MKVERIESLRATLLDYQRRIEQLGHKLDNPRITLASRLSVESSLRELKIMWYDAMCNYHAHPEYVGHLSYQKENNPFR